MFQTPSHQNNHKNKANIDTHNYSWFIANILFIVQLTADKPLLVTTLIYPVSSLENLRVYSGLVMVWFFSVFYFGYLKCNVLIILHSKLRFQIWITIKFQCDYCALFRIILNPDKGFVSTGLGLVYYGFLFNIFTGLLFKLCAYCGAHAVQFYMSFIA